MAVTSIIKIDTKSAQKSVADLEKDLQEVNEQLRNVAIGSDAFNALQKKAAECKGQIDQFNRTTDTLSKGFQGWGENAAKVTAGISGGITAATAALQLMGVENENVTAGIAKLQQLMAFTQGISSLKDLSEGFKNLKGAIKVVTGSMHGLKGAIVATGIGALVVAIGALVANWDKVTASVDKFIGKAGEASKVTAALQGVFAGLKQSVVAIGNAIVQYVTAPFKSIVAAINAYNDTEGGLFDKIKAAAGAAKGEIVAAGQSTVDGFKEIGTRAGEAFNNSIDEQNTAHAAERKKEADERAYQAYLQGQREAQRYAEGLEILDKLEEELATRRKERKNIEAPEIEAEEEQEDPWVDKIKGAQEYYRSIMDMGMSEAEAFERQQSEQLSILKKYLDEGLITQQQYDSAVAVMDEQAALRKKALMKEAALGIADILSSLSDTMDETNKEQFKAMKAMQIASATIQMMVGITTALSGAFTTKTGPWDIALAVIQATSIAASGAAQIAQISRQQYNSDSSASAAVSSSALASTITSPTQYSQAVEGASTEATLRDVKSYVSVVEINKTQHRVAVSEGESRY